jgi:hypothetical protein
MLFPVSLITRDCERLQTIRHCKLTAAIHSNCVCSSDAPMHCTSELKTVHRTLMHCNSVATIVSKSQDKTQRAMNDCDTACAVQLY